MCQYKLFSILSEDFFHQNLNYRGSSHSRPLIGQNSLQDGFCLFSKFYNSSHSTALLLSTLIGLFIKKILYSLRPMRGPPVLTFRFQSSTFLLKVVLFCHYHPNIACKCLTNTKYLSISEYWPRTKFACRIRSSGQSIFMVSSSSRIT